MKKAIRTIIVAALLIGIVVGYYYYLNNKNGATNETNVELTEVDKILQKDFETDYPATPRAVVKWYNRISMVLYNNEFEEKEYKPLALALRNLLDDELLTYNPEDVYLQKFETEIEEYKQYERKIIRAEYPSSNDIEYKTVNGDECAYVTVYYFGKEGNNYTRSYQQFVLRQDKDGKWKILTFTKTKQEDE